MTIIAHRALSKWYGGEKQIFPVYAEETTARARTRGEKQRSQVGIEDGFKAITTTFAWEFPMVGTTRLQHI